MRTYSGSIKSNASGVQLRWLLVGSPERSEPRGLGGLWSERATCVPYTCVFQFVAGACFKVCSCRCSRNMCRYAFAMSAGVPGSRHVESIVAPDGRIRQANCLCSQHLNICTLCKDPHRLRLQTSSMRSQRAEFAWAQIFPAFMFCARPEHKYMYKPRLFAFFHNMLYQYFSGTRCCRTGS